MEEKEFDYAGIEEVFEIIERKDFIEFAELIDYIFENVEHYKREYLMMIVCDNSYVIVKYLESKKRLYQENEQEKN
jgi:hypothetical protein